MKIAVLGAGITGVTTAYYLAKEGQDGLGDLFKQEHADQISEYAACNRCDGA